MSPWDTRQYKHRRSRDFLFFTVEELQFLPGHQLGVPGTPSHPVGFHEKKLYVIFSYVPSLPRQKGWFLQM